MLFEGGVTPAYLLMNIGETQWYLKSINVAVSKE